MTQSAAEMPEPVASGTAKAQQGSGQYLTFQLAGDTYGIDILNTREILEYGNVTSVPMMPDFIAGVINLRGSVVPVIDLRSRFGNGGKLDINKRTSVIIVELSDKDETLEIGVIVDAVNEVLNISPEQIEPAPTFGAKIRTDFISGMGNVDERFLVLLDIDCVLSIDELAMVQQAAAEVPTSSQHVEPSEPVEGASTSEHIEGALKSD